MKAIFFLWILLFVVLTAIRPEPSLAEKTALAKVQPIYEMDGNRDILLSLGPLNLLDPEIPRNKKFIGEAAKILQSLILPKDGTEDIAFVVIDDMRPNAFFTTLESGKKIVGVTSGAVHHFVKNDDHLAALFGHELSHGVSTLREVNRDLDAKDSSLKKAHAKLLQRLEENEVDALSALERLQPTGYNPNAMTEVLQNIAVLVGDDLNNTHTLTSSRIGTTSISLTAAKRKFGTQVLSDEKTNYRTARTKDYLAYLHSPGALKSRKTAAEAVLARPVPDAFAPPQKGLTPPAARELGGLYFTKDPYGDITKKSWSEIQRLTFGILSPEAETALNLRLHENVGNAQLEQIARAYGEDFKPASAEKLQNALDLVRTSFYPDLVSPNQVVKDLSNLEAERATILASTSVDPQVSASQIQQLDAKIAANKKQMAYVRALYKSEEPITKYKAAWQKRLQPVADNDLLLRHDEFTVAEEKFLSEIKVLGKQQKQFIETYTSILGKHIHLATDTVKKLIPHENVRMLHNYAYMDPQAAGRASIIFLKRYAAFINSKKKLKPMDLYNLNAFFSNDSFRSVLEAVAKVNQSAIEDFSHSIHVGLIAQQPSMERLGYFQETLARMANSKEQPLKSSWFSKVSTHPPALESFLKAARKKIEVPDEPGGRRATTELNNVLGFMPDFEKLGADNSAGAKSVKKQLVAYVTKILDTEISAIPSALRPKISRKELAALMVLQDPKIRELVKYIGFEDLRESNIAAVYQSIDQEILRTIPQGEIRMNDLAEFMKPEELYPLVFRHRETISPGVHGDLTEIVQGIYPQKSYDTTYGYENWLKQNQPQNVVERMRNSQAGHTHKLPGNEHYFDFLDKILLERFTVHKKSAAAGDLKAIGFQVGLEMNEEFSNWSILNVDLLSKFIEKEFSRLQATSLKDAADFLVGYAKGARESGKSVGGGVDQFLPLESIRFFVENPAAVEQLGADSAAEIFDLLLMHWSSTPGRDQVFENVWKLTENRPDLRKKFLDPQFVKELYYDENKMMIAKWQLEHKFDLSKEFAEKRGGKTGFRNSQEVRQKVKDAVDYVKQIIADPSPMRDNLLEFTEDRLMTNEAETNLVASEKALTDLKKAATNKKMLLLEAPMEASKRLKSNQERLNLIEYLIGARDDLGIDPNQYMSPGNNEPFRDVNHNLRRQFSEQNPAVRTYVINALFENERGIFEEKEVYERLVRRIMGEYADNKLLRNIFDSYIKVLPESERKVVLANVLSSFSATKKGRVSLGKIFDAMGPFGYVVAQNLRSSDLVKGALVKELDGYFDRADPPKRNVVFGQLKKIFGEKLVSISLNEELGAGSKNYVYLAKIKDPKTGSIVTKALRIQRDHLEGLIANENGNWTRALEELSTQTDPETKRIANLLEEVRANTMVSLEPGGAELDQSIERAAFGKAKDIYAREGRITVATPDIELLESLVPPEHRRFFSIYNHVDHTPLDQLPPEKAQAKANEVIEAELHAVFDRGEFDADAHIGNWLYDKTADNLVRIDYAQITQLDEFEKKSFREVFTSMLFPRMGANQLEVLLDNFSQVFQTSPINLPKDKLRLALSAIARDPGFPEAGSPLDRLLFLREKLEGKLGAGTEVRIKPKVHKAFGLLARIRLFDRFLGRGEFNKAVLAHLPQEQKTGLTRAYIKSRVIAAVKTVTSPTCAGFFAKLKSVFRTKAKP